MLHVGIGILAFARVMKGHISDVLAAQVSMNGEWHHFLETKLSAAIEIKTYSWIVSRVLSGRGLGFFSLASFWLFGAVFCFLWGRLDILGS